MARLADQTAATAQLQIGSATYSMSPLTWQDYGEFDRWLQDRVLDTLATERFTGLPDDEKDKVRREIVAMSFLVRFSHKDDGSDSAKVSQRFTDSPDGISMLLWLGIRPHHPDVTLDDIREAVLSHENVMHLFSRWSSVNKLIDELEPDSAKKKNPSQTNCSGDSGSNTPDAPAASSS